MKRIVVVGAGPAGMMAAIAAAEHGGSVLLFEKMPRAGRKMMITGKGRCNVTSADDPADIIKNIAGNGRFLNSVIRAFDNAAVMAFFENVGVPLKTERGNRVFPQSDRAVDVVDAMMRPVCAICMWSFVRIRTCGRLLLQTVRFSAFV